MTSKSFRKSLHNNSESNDDSEPHGVEKTVRKPMRKSVDEVFGVLKRKDTPVLSVGQQDDAVKSMIAKTSSSHKSGITLVGCITMSALVVILFAAVFPLISNLVMKANMRVVCRKGQKVHAEISRASAEREAVGLSGLWPSDQAYTNRLSGEIESLSFTNSTDYFSYLYCEISEEYPKRSFFSKGFDYSLLAGPGVASCTNSVLHWKNNMWSIAKNIPNCCPENIPLIVTRNLDADSLLACYSKDDEEACASLGSEFDSPFSNKKVVLVRKNGQSLVVQAKCSYRAVYGVSYFDFNVDRKRGTVTHPLKYLTPRSEVLPVGEQY